MGGLITSLTMGFLLASLSVWLVHYIQSRYAQKERKLSLLLLKRARRD